MSEPALKVHTVAIDSLTPDPENARKHSRKNLDAIAGSLRQFGQRRPLVVHGDVVIAGNGTLEAARSLGWTHVAITRTPASWSFEQARAYALADNRTAELAEWDDKILADQLVELDAVGWDLAEIGFEALEPPTDPGQEDSTPTVPSEPISKLGDLWQIGPHRVVCGDGTDPATRTRLLGNTRPDATVTDPPYGISANKMALGTGKKDYHRGGDWDEIRPPVAWVVDEAPVSIIWGGNYFADVLPINNDWLCWHKKIANVSFSEFELAWSNTGKNCRIISHHWSGEDKMHPTQKPLPVMVWCMSFLPEAAVVFDPFAGSGSTLVAAARTGRVGRGVELDPAYVDVIVKRLENETGLSAERVIDG